MGLGGGERSRAAQSPCPRAHELTTPPATRARRWQRRRCDSVVGVGRDAEGAITGLARGRAHGAARARRPAKSQATLRAATLRASRALGWSVMTRARWRVERTTGEVAGGAGMRGVVAHVHVTRQRRRWASAATIARGGEGTFGALQDLRGVRQAPGSTKAEFRRRVLVAGGRTAGRTDSVWHDDRAASAAGLRVGTEIPCSTPSTELRVRARTPIWGRRVGTSCVSR